MSYGVVITLLIIGALTYFYLRTLSMSAFVSIAGSIILPFCGYAVMGSTWGHAGNVLSAMFLLFAFEQLYLKKQWIFFPFAIIASCSSLFHFYLLSVFLLLYSIFRYFGDNGWQPKPYFKLIGQMILLGILGVGIQFVNIVSPYLEQLTSSRVAGNSSFIQSAGAAPVFHIDNFSERLTSLYRIFSTDLMGNGSFFTGWYNYFEAPAFYTGLLTLLLIPQIFVYLTKRERISYSIYFGFWLLLALVPWFRHALYLFVGNYYKNGFNTFISVTLIFFAMHSLSKIDKLGKVNLPLLGGMLAFLLGLLFFPFKAVAANMIDKELRQVIAAFLVGYSIIIIGLKFQSIKTIAKIALLMLIFVEVAYLSNISINKRLAFTKREFDQSAGGFKDVTLDAVKYLKENDKSFYRVEKDYSSGAGQHGSLNDAAAQGFYSTPSYHSMNQQHYIHFLEETNVITKGDETQSRWAPGFRGRPLLQTFGSVKYRLAKGNYSLYSVLFGYDSIAKFKDVTLLRNRNYLPLGFTYDKYITFKEFSAIPDTNNFQNPFFSPKDREFLNKVFTPKDITLYKTVVVNDDDIGKFKELTKFDLGDSIQYIDWQRMMNDYAEGVKTLKIDTLAIKHHSHNKIEGTIKVANSKLLFLSIPYDDGWQATVDGKSADLLRVNIGFTGLLLPKGEHTVVLEYWPPLMKTSLGVSAIFILIFIFVVLRYLKFPMKYKLIGLAIMFGSYAINLLLFF